MRGREGEGQGFTGLTGYILSLLLSASFFLSILLFLLLLFITIITIVLIILIIPLLIIIAIIGCRVYLAWAWGSRRRPGSGV